MHNNKHADLSERPENRFVLFCGITSLLQMDDDHLEVQHVFSEVKYLNINVITEIVLFLRVLLMALELVR